MTDHRTNLRRIVAARHETRYARREVCRAAGFLLLATMLGCGASRKAIDDEVAKPGANAGNPVVAAGARCFSMAAIMTRNNNTSIAGWISAWAPNGVSVPDIYPKTQDVDRLDASKYVNCRYWRDDGSASSDPQCTYPTQRGHFAGLKGTPYTTSVFAGCATGGLSMCFPRLVVGYNTSAPTCTSISTLVATEGQVSWVIVLVPKGSSIEKVRGSTSNGLGQNHWETCGESPRQEVIKFPQCGAAHVSVDLYRIVGSDYAAYDGSDGYRMICTKPGGNFEGECKVEVEYTPPNGLASE